MHLLRRERQSPIKETTGWIGCPPTSGKVFTVVGEALPAPRLRESAADKLVRVIQPLRAVLTPSCSRHPRNPMGSGDALLLFCWQIIIESARMRIPLGEIHRMKSQHADGQRPRQS